MFEESLSRQEMRQGEVITAEVVRIDHNFVVVNAGLKSESFIPIEEFHDDRGELDVKEGDFVSVAIEALEDGYGETRLSRDRAKRLSAWINLEKALESGEQVDGTITGKVKGGLTVMTNGIRAFLRWRRAQPGLVGGTIRFIETPEPILAFVRQSDTQRLVAAFNLGGAPATLQLPTGLRDATTLRIEGFASCDAGAGQVGEFEQGPSPVRPAEGRPNGLASSLGIEQPIVSGKSVDLQDPRVVGRMRPRVFSPAIG